MRETILVIYSFIGIGFVFGSVVGAALALLLKKERKPGIKEIKEVEEIG